MATYDEWQHSGSIKRGLPIPNSLCILQLAFTMGIPINLLIIELAFATPFMSLLMSELAWLLACFALGFALGVLGGFLFLGLLYVLLRVRLVRGQADLFENTM